MFTWNNCNEWKRTYNWISSLRVFIYREVRKKVILGNWKSEKKFVASDFSGGEKGRDNNYSTL
jgi:hypothetical protein